MKKTLYRIFISVVAVLIIATTNSYATTISYEVTDLIDSTSGEDLWQYSYTVSDYTFNENYGFTIFFDYSLYSGLEIPPPYVNANWDPIVWQPDADLTSDGAYDALALVDGASLMAPFIVSFVWLGTDTPGSQPFDIYYLDDAGIINVFESGQTTLAAAPVPEPATFLLLGTGLICLAGIRKKMKLNQVRRDLKKEL